MSDTWSDAHVREARAATFRLAEKAALDNNQTALEWLLCCSRHSEEVWRRDLKYAGYSKRRIDNEVNRVKKLVSGEWVRETFWLVGGEICHGGEMKAKMIADQTGETVTKRVKVGKKHV